ncbi:MAG: MFS transporter [Chloroflexota bacterium]|nr:MFS transporter [Chloroflexota bacterium]MDE2968714.1 MFS transporter [Chloroflexota bacterium]
MQQSTKPRLFYGWYVVWGMIIVGATAMAVAGPTYGLFIEPMRESLGWSRALFGWTQTGHLLAAAVGGLVIGRLIDRYGARVLLAVAGGIAALLLGSLSFFHPAWWFILAYVVTGLVGIHGPASIYGAPVVAKWFVRQRARALGILSMGAPFGLLIAFPAVQWVIETYGWRTGWLTLGIIGLAVIVPVSLLVFKRQPEDIGLMPDGDPPREARTSGPRLDPEARQWTRSEAMRTPVFWRITLAYSVFTFCTTSMVIFRFPYFVGEGMDASIMSVAAGTAQIWTLVGAVTMGRQVDIVGLERLLALNMLIMMTCFILTLNVQNAFMMFVALYLWAWAINSLGALQGIVYAAYFGRQHAGAVRSVALLATMLFAATAGPVTGYVADTTGGYEAVWWPCVGILVLSALLLVTARPPLHHPTSREAASAGT